MSTGLANVNHELTAQEAEFVDLLITENLSPPAAAARVGISRASGYLWVKRPHVVEAINDILKGNKTRIRLKSASLIDKAFERIENALDNPNVTPTMLKAAGMVLMYASGDERQEQAGNNFTVVVNTTTGNDVLAQQQARANRARPVLEATYAEIPDDE